MWLGMDFTSFTGSLINILVAVSWECYGWCGCTWLETAVTFSSGWRCTVNDLLWPQRSRENSFESKQQPSGGQGDVVCWQREGLLFGHRLHYYCCQPFVALCSSTLGQETCVFYTAFPQLLLHSQNWLCRLLDFSSDFF